jgi:maltose/maltodextrin transport system substrate-binding protein/arabinogalactan oligomer/maltooligosaccharide transport system substrate-binding protein
MLLAACGGGAEPTVAPAPTAAPVAEAPTEAPAPTEPPAVEEPAPTEAPAEEPAPTEPPAVEGAITCPAGSPTLLIWADDTRAGVLNDLAPTVLAETGVCLSIQLVGFGDIRGGVALSAPAGEGPDVFVGAHDWLGELYSNGVVAPMDLGAKAADFSPVALEAFSYEGTLYGLPYAVENLAFLCNPDLVPEPPATWTEVQEASAASKEAGDLTQWFAITAGDPYNHEPTNTAFGGYIFGQTEAGYDACDVGLDSEGAIAYLTWIDTMVKDGLLSADIDWDTAHVLFETGKAACISTGPWALERFDTAGAKYTINSFPGETQDASPFVGVQGFMINSFSENKVLAQSFLTDYVATTPVMEGLYLAGNRPPAYLPAEGVMDDNAKAFAAIVPSGHPMPAIPAMNAVWDAWGTAITTVFQQSATPADAAATAAQQVRSAAGCE